MDTQLKDELAATNDTLMCALKRFHETRSERDRQRAHFAFQLAVTLAETIPYTPEEKEACTKNTEST